MLVNTPGHGESLIEMILLLDIHPKLLLTLFFKKIGYFSWTDLLIEICMVAYVYETYEGTRYINVFLYAHKTCMYGRGLHDHASEHQNGVNAMVFFLSENIILRFLIKR